MARILHLALADDFQALAPDEPYLPPGFQQDGFIHCTQGGDVLLRVANAFYRNVAGEFLVLIIDADKVGAPVKYEPPAPIAGGRSNEAESILFPHIYGPLNRDAIAGIARALRDGEGIFLGFDRALDEAEV